MLALRCIYINRSPILSAARQRYAANAAGEPKLIYMDEVGTPDSSRIWDGAAYRDGRVVENSKEGFRKMLQARVELSCGHDY